MAWTRVLAWIVVMLMAALSANVLFNGSLDEGLGMDRFIAGLADPWSTLIGFDLMAGLLLVAGWIIWRQGNARALDTVAWVLCLTWWGNIVTATYILVALRQSGGDPARFFTGARAGTLQPAWTPQLALRLALLIAAMAVAVFAAGRIAALGFGSLPGQAYLPGFGPIMLALVLLAFPAGRAPPERALPVAVDNPATNPGRRQQADQRNL